MPTEKRNLRSNKSDNQPPADTDKSRSNSGTTNKKPTPTRSTSSKAKSTVKPESASEGKKMSGDKRQPNGTDPIEDETNDAEDVEMSEESSKPKKTTKSGKGKDGDEEMTVVVPPSKSSKTTSNGKQSHTENNVNGAVDGKEDSADKPQLDPKEKAIDGNVS